MPRGKSVLERTREEEEEGDADGSGAPRPHRKSLILCTNVLPVLLERDASNARGWKCRLDTDSLFEDGPLYVGLRQLSEYDVKHVGVPASFVPEAEREQVEALLLELNCYPVWCDAKRAHNHFQGYCKGILWPTFHNVIDLYSRANPQAVLDSVNDGGLAEGESGAPGALGARSVSGGSQHAPGGSGESAEEVAWRPARSWSPLEGEVCWPDYCAMNGLFARAVVEIYGEGDVVWAHDYHLLLLPNYLLRKLQNARIGLFLHVPFPSSEIFRTLGTREEILRAMLCADHLGFDLYEYARHFLTCCSRMLGLSYEARQGGVLVVNYNGRDVHITCSHTALDLDFLRGRLESREVHELALRVAQRGLASDVAAAQAQAQGGPGGLGAAGAGTGNSVEGKARVALPHATAAAAHAGVSAAAHALAPAGGVWAGAGVAAPAAPSGLRRQVIVAVDEVEGLRGLGLKLLALDRLFTDYAYLRGRVVLRQVGLKLDSRPNDYQSCHDEVAGLMEVIVQKWGPCIEYEEHASFNINQRLALLQSADVYLNTTIRAGGDMLPFEYLIARTNPAGCIVMSEFAACSRVLQGSLKVNPFKTSALAATIEEALSMSLSERTARSARDLEYIERSPLRDWARRVISDIERSHTDSQAPLTRFGGGFATRVLNLATQRNKKQQPLAPLDLAEAFKSHARRLILLDYGGTLVETSSLDMYMKRDGGHARTWHYEGGGSKRPGGSLETRDPLPDAARATLIDLCRDTNNTVVVISSDLRDELDHALAGIPNLALVAENGFVFRMRPDAPWTPAVDAEAESGGDWYGGNASMAVDGDASPAGSGPRRSNSRSSDGGDDDARSEAGSSTGGDAQSERSSAPGSLSGPSMGNWQETTMEVMRQYAYRTNGSFVWQSPSTTSFNYVLADPELGKQQAKNLSLELEQLLAVMPLTVEQGKGFVTVRLRGVNRGTAVREIISSINSRPQGKLPAPQSSKIDFIVAFGDDTEDESMFHATNKYRSTDANTKTFSVRVASSATSKAKWFVTDAEEVVETLSECVKAAQNSGQKVRRNFSQGKFADMTGATLSDSAAQGMFGNFKTKQSALKLSEQDRDEGDEERAGAPTSSGAGMATGMPTAAAAAAAAAAAPAGGGMTHSPSYVVRNAQEMDELFGPGASAGGMLMPPIKDIRGAAGGMPPTAAAAGDDDMFDGFNQAAMPPMDPRAIPPSGGAPEEDDPDADRPAAPRRRETNDDDQDLGEEDEDEDEMYDDDDYRRANPIPLHDTRAAPVESVDLGMAGPYAALGHTRTPEIKAPVSPAKTRAGPIHVTAAPLDAQASAEPAAPEPRPASPTVPAPAPRTPAPLPPTPEHGGDDDEPFPERDTLKLALAALAGAGMAVLVLGGRR